MGDKGLRLINIIVNKLKLMSLCSLLLLSIVASEIFTGIIVSIMSILFHGRVTHDYLISGAITALIVSFIVVFVLIQLLKQFQESEKKISAIFDNTIDGILLADKENKRFFTGNKMICDMLGYSLEEIKTLGVVDIHPEKDLPYVIDQFERQARGEFTVAMDIPVKRKDGSVFFADINSSPVTLADKEYLMGIFRDITERKKAEDALQRAKKEWEATFDAISDPLFIHDSEFRVVRANRAYAEAAGISFSEIIGRLYYEIFPKMESPFNECLKTLRLQEEEVSVPLTGKTYKIRFYSVTIMDSKYSVHILEDITERKSAEDAIRESEEKFKNLAASAQDAIIIMDNEGYISYWNNAAERMFGYSVQEALGKELHIFLMPRHYYEAYRKGFSTFKESGQGPVVGKTVEVIALKKDGTEFPIELSISVVKLKGKWNAIGILRDITERKKAEEKIKAEMEITSHLLMIAEATAHTTDIDKLMEQVVHCSCKILGSDICLSYLWDKEAKVFRPSQPHGLTHGLMPMFMTEHLKEDVGFIKKANEGRMPVVITDFELQNDNYAPYTLQSTIFSWLPDINTLIAIPLIGKEDYLGLIVGIYKISKEFTERDKNIMKGISYQVSTGLEEAMLYRESIDRTMELSHKIETIQVMHEIDRSILSTLESQEILETAIRLISRVISCDRATVALVDKEKNGLIYEAGFGTTVIPKGAFVPFEDTSAAEVVKTGRTQYIADMREVKRRLLVEERLFKEGFLSHIRVPLIVKGGVAGVLSIGSKSPSAFTPENLSTLEKIASQIGVALENARLVTDLKELFIGTVKSLSSAIDAKSHWTAGHSERVTKYALDIGKKMGLSEKDLKDLELAGLLHDIGKIGTYEAILDKPWKLTEEELELVRKHPEKGAEILSPIKQLKEIIPAIKYHHEFYDGTGYPDGLKGDSIPLLAGILTVADTVDAMSADRPYRKGKPMDEIIAELKRCSGTQFDPQVVKAFLSTIS